MPCNIAGLKMGFSEPGPLTRHNTDVVRLPVAAQDGRRRRLVIRTDAALSSYLAPELTYRVSA
jgi:hypothetical protein